ncbi:MAG: retroviral-like aspartic protease family protein [Ramlibacter sp.]
MQRRAFLSSATAMAIAGLPGCGGSGGSPQEDTVPVGAATEIAMDYANPHISVQALVNGSPLRLLLDTGADGNLLSAAVAQALGLVLSQERVPLSGGGGNADPVPWTTIDSLAVGGVAQRAARAYVVSLPQGFPWDGVLGATFFRDFVPAFDYAGRTLRLTPAGAFVPVAGDVALPLQALDGGKLLVQARVGDVVGWFSVDTGAKGSVTVFRPTVERLGLRERWAPAVRTVTGNTVSGPVHGDMVRAPSLGIGSWHWAGVPVELSLEEAGLFGSDGWAGNIGGEVWRRFTVTPDYRGRTLWLRPNTELNTPFVDPRLA